MTRFPALDARCCLLGFAAMVMGGFLAAMPARAATHAGIVEEYRSMKVVEGDDIAFGRVNPATIGSPI